MTIKNVVRTATSVLSIAGGTTVTLTGDPLDGAPYITYHNACKRGTAWFEGRLWTFKVWQWGPAPAYTAAGFLRWDNVPNPNMWMVQPDYTTARQLNVLSMSGMDRHFGVPGLIAFKDNVFMFWDIVDSDTAAVSTTHSWAYMRWNSTSGVNGLTTVEASHYSSTPGYYERTYSKSLATVDNGHILDAIEYGGNLYFATPVNVITVTPPSGDMTLLDEPSTNWDDMVARTFGIFKAGSGAGMLYVLDANGKVKQITGLVSEVADLKLVNPNIINGNTASLGYGPALVQIGSRCYAFLNDTTGTVLFSTLDGVNWTEVSGTLPAGWQNTHSHIKCVIDPSVPEVRVMFIHAGTGTFDIYSFDGTTFTYLGSAAATNNVSYTFFDMDAADAELEGTVTVNTGLGTANIPFQLFREVTATGTINVAAEYSLDGGATWNTATGVPKLSLDASDSRPVGTGASYTFVWQWLTDLGSGLYSNVRFRVRSV